MSDAKLTQGELRVIKERADKATSGPWIGAKSTTHRDTFDIRKSDGEYLVETYANSDMNFIAHAREDVPKLVAEVERYQKYIEALKHVYWNGTDYELEQMIMHGKEALE